jgi:beta-fructofuranosidase
MNVSHQSNFRQTQGNPLTPSQDPCAPFYDPKTNLYHVSYQSSLDLTNADWGDIAWRSATSPDLVSWTVQHEPTLTPDTAYDGKGVFTGCKVPSRDGSLTCVYTSIGALPIHHTLPHVVGSESLSMAKSCDSGKTWQKFAGNPILPNEPKDLDVTGWRDPYVSSWPSMATALNRDAKDTLFGIISGGIRDVTPTTFLYAIDANDLTDWQYVGPLVDFGLNLRPSRWSGDLGKNWEVTNFVSLTDEKNTSITRDFLIMGTEGCLPSALSQETPTPPQDPSSPSRPQRNQLWMSGSLEPTTTTTINPSQSPVQMPFTFGSHLDHGAFYAANSFFDPSTSKHIVWGWITEEDLCDDLRHAQNWSGLLSLPREIHLQTLENVVRAWKSDLKDITSFECEADNNEHGTYTLRTLASEPVHSVVKKLREKATIRRANTLTPLQPQSSHNPSSDILTTTKTWELDCSFALSSHCSSIGLQLLQPHSPAQTTTISFSPNTETFIITRPSSPDSSAQFNTTPELAPHTLFTSLNPATNELENEELRIRIWRDNSVLEVFVNGRTAISTRLYASAEQMAGLRFFADDGGCEREKSRLREAVLWDGLAV